MEHERDACVAFAAIEMAHLASEERWAELAALVAVEAQADVAAISVSEHARNRRHMIVAAGIPDSDALTLFHRARARCPLSQAVDPGLHAIDLAGAGLLSLRRGAAIAARTKLDRGLALEAIIACAAASRIDRAMMERARSVIKATSRVFIRALERAPEQYVREAMGSLLDELSLGAFALDSESKLLRANAIGAAILDANDGLYSSAGAIRALDRDEDQRLAQALAEAHTGGRGVLRITRPSRLRPYSIIVTSCRAAGLRALTGPALLIIVADSERTRVECEALLRETYGLSSAESRLAIAIAEGARLHDAARSFGVTLETVRSQLKRILAKTATTRQVDLVRLILTRSGAPLG